ncbi:hypothetical protein A0J61_03891 [Choanephora cucurbitarum]|uniref:peptidylprolyl isomerase n=1 Tax=Choanephora cucurbitarum TaxID=101091 RepID=A0A1C7NGB1_9FUNG|nr:hypothetical protein A0J61_03891 [Choanephora cucurbitarum]
MTLKVFYKIVAVFLLTTIFVFAKNTEEGLEQPTKLLGGIIRQSESCKQKVINNARVKLHYRARAWGNEEFFENTYLDKPMEYKIGRDKIMKGLEQGIDGMCVGEVRRLLVPADLAYGSTGLPNIVPPNTAVIYEVEVLEVDSPYRNPWFWAGIAFMFFGWRFSNRLTKMRSKSSSAEFLEKKALEAKSQ